MYPSEITRYFVDILGNNISELITTAFFSFSIIYTVNKYKMKIIISQIVSYLITIVVTFVIFVKIPRNFLLDVLSSTGSPFGILGFSLSSSLVVGFRIAVLLSLLYIYRKYIKVFRGSIIPPYIDSQVRLPTASSEYSLKKKKKNIVVWFCVSLLVLVVSHYIFQYQISARNEFITQLTYLSSPDSFSSSISYLISSPVRDQLPRSQNNPDEVISAMIFFWVWLPSLPLCAAYMNIIGYTHERLRPFILQKLLMKIK